MRKRCSVIADTRPPLKMLKSATPRSNIKEVPRAAKIPRVDQSNGEVVDCRSSLLDTGEANENVCPTEHGEQAADPTERKRRSSDTPCTETDGVVV